MFVFLIPCLCDILVCLWAWYFGVFVSRSKASVPEILSEEIDVIDPVADTEENAEIISVSSQLCVWRMEGGELLFARREQEQLKRSRL